MATVTTAYPAQLAARTSQRSPSAKVISGNAQNLNGGTVLMGGDRQTNSPLTKDLTIGDNLGEPKTLGSLPVENAELGTSKADSSGTFLNDVDDMIMLVDSAVSSPASDQKNNGIKLNTFDNMQKKSDTTIDFKSGQLTDIVILGSDLITNGELTSGTSWSEVNVTYDSNGAQLSASGGSVDQDITVVADRWYKAVFTVKNLSGSGATFTDGGAGSKLVDSMNKIGISALAITEVSSITYYIKPATTSIDIGFATAVGTTMGVSDLSLFQCIDIPIQYTISDGTETLSQSTVVDDAAHPTKSIPGELQFYDGSKLPKQADYSTKNSI